MAGLDDLLRVQEHDSAVDRLRVQRERLPERVQLDEQRAKAQELSDRLANLRAERDEVEREEKRHEDNVAAIEERRADVEHAMYSGSTSNPKELQAMQAEVEQFNRQQSGIEDQQIEAMERREGLEAQIGGLEEELGETEAEIERLETTLAQQETAIDDEVASEQSQRESLVPGIPDDLIELYEKIRQTNNGVGAARLSGGTCMGCHLALPAMEIDRIKREPADAVVRCDQCGAILVR